MRFFRSKKKVISSILVAILIVITSLVSTSANLSVNIHGKGLLSFQTNVALAAKTLQIPKWQQGYVEPMSYQTSTNNYEIDLSGEIVHIGSATSSFSPVIRFNRFGGESYVELNLIGGGNVARFTSSTLNPDGSITADNQYFTLTYKPTGIKQGFNELGGIDYIFTLKKNPGLNVLTFTYNHQKANAYLQPPLTQEEIAQGCFQPDYVINSIAFYGDPEQVNNTYKTGKIGHLYRLRTSNGYWCDWGFGGGQSQITLTVPQEALDAGPYPITIAPVGDTFGSGSTGGTGMTLNANWWVGDLHTGAAGTAQSISMRCSGDESVHFKGTLVNHSDLTIINNGIGDASPSIGIEDWYISDFGTDPTISAIDYVVSTVLSGNVFIKYDSGVADQCHYESDNNYTSPANPDTVSHATYLFSIYCTYTPGGGEPSVSNNPSSKDFGVVSPSTKYWANGSDPALGSTESTKSPISSYVANSSPHQMLVTYPSGWTQDGGTTKYQQLEGDCDYGTNETPSQMIIRDSYVFTKLKIYVLTNTATGSSIYTLRKNGVDTSLSLSISSEATGFFASTSTIPFANGDLLSLKSVVNGTGAITITSIAMTYFGDSYVAQINYYNSNGAILNVSSPSYIAIGGNISANVTSPESEASVRYKSEVASTYSNMRIYISSANSVDSVFHFRINGADGNQVITVPSGQTGSFEDTTHSDNVSVGDYINYSYDGGGNLSYTLIQTKVVSDNQLQIAAVGTPFNYGHPNEVNFNGIATIIPIVQAVGTEARAQVDLQASYTIKNLEICIPANTLDGSTNVTLRKNGSDTTLTLTVTSGQTGVFEDISNSVSIVAGDLVNLAVSQGGTTGNIQVSSMGVELEFPVSIGWTDPTNAYGTNNQYASGTSASGTGSYDPTANTNGTNPWTNPIKAYSSDNDYTTAVMIDLLPNNSPTANTNGTLPWTNPANAYSSNNVTATAVYPALVYTNNSSNVTGTGWTNPTNAYSDNSANTTITSGTPSGNNIWGNYGFSLTGYTVTQVRVRYDAWSDGYSTGATYATKLPGSDGDSTGSISVYPTTPTTKWDKVDELVATNGNGIVILTNNDIQLFYASSNFTVPVGATNISVSVIYTASDNVSGTNKVTGQIKVNGTAYTHTTNNEPPNAGTWTQFTSTWTQNPNTTANWTVDDVNGVAAAAELQQFGVKASDATPDVNVSQCYLRVDYTPAVQYDDKIGIDVSWDGGTSWTTSSNTTLTSAQATTWYDVTALAGGWTPAKLADGQLKVRVIAYTVNNAELVRLDWLPVEVTIASPTFDHIYGTFGNTGSAVITKVEIGYEAWASVANQKLNFYTTGDGSTWSGAHLTDALTTSDPQAETWIDITADQSPWDWTKLNNTNFKIKVASQWISGTPTWSIDWISVRITLTAPVYDQIFGTFSITGTATITKVEVGYEAFATATQKMNIYTSQNGGAGWSGAHDTGNLVTADPNSYTYIDVTADQGDGWVWAELSDANLKIKIATNYVNGTPTWSVDHLTIRVTANTATPSTIYTTYGFSILDAPTKVEIGIEGYTSAVSAKNISVGISWDGGSNWSANHTISLPTSDNDAIQWYDCTADTTWTANSVNDTNLQVKMTHDAGDSSYEYVDYVPVRVTYTVTLQDGSCTFIVSNNGTIAIDIDFKATNFTSASSNWTLGSPDATHAQLTVFLGGASTGTALTTGDQEIVSNLGTSSHKHWEVTLDTPTSDPFPDGDQKTSVITLTARAVS